MNKSLILVMCDVLVLSAMSLSTGGFEDDAEKDYQAGHIDVTEAFQATTNELSVAQGEMSDLKDKVRRLEETLKYAKAAESNAVVHANAAIYAASNDVRQAEEKRKAAEAEAERHKRWANEQVMAEKLRSLEAVSNAVVHASAVIYAVSNDMRRLEGQRKTVEAEFERFKRRANEQVTAEKLRNKEIESNANIREKKYIAEINETKSKLKEKSDELEETRRKLAKSKRSVQENSETIERALCRVTVTTTKGKDEPAFYSPIVDFKGEAYVMVDNYEASRLDMMKSILVVSNSGEEPRTYDKPDAYYLVDGGRKLDIVLLKLQGEGCWTNRMTLGQRKADSSPYWVRRNTGKVFYMRPSINQKELNDMLKGLKRGDMCVDVEEHSIVGLYVKKNDKFTFDEPNLKLRKWPFEDEKGRK